MERLLAFLARPRSPGLLAALAIALSLPALSLGFQLDDHYLRLALGRPALEAAWQRSPLDAFAFFRGEPGFTHAARDAGSVPWWVDERLKLAFARPLSGLTHGLDFALWPGSPALMHAHSLVWLGLCVAAGALLFRELDLPPPAAALAALAFALDDAHGTPAAWIANRNALVATTFALLALVAHHRWRARGWRPGALLAPLALLLGLLGGEVAVATGAYLLGYALFVDRAPLRMRLASLVPCGAVSVAWALAYRGLGYGTAHSTLYVDPGATPGPFLEAFVRRAPVLFFGQWALPADLNGLMSTAAQRGYWLAGVAAVIAVSALLAPLLRRDRHARFFATGMALSAVPAAATFPSNRLLMLAGVGGAGLLGLWMARWRELPPAGSAGRVVRRVALGLALLFHFALAPLGLLGAADGVRMLGGVPTGAVASLGPDLGGRHLLIVQAPSAFLAGQSLLERTLAGVPAVARAHVLASGLGPLSVTRLDARTLELSPAGGYLAEAGSLGRDGRPPQPLDPHHMLGIFDRIYRAEPFAVGARVALGGFEAEVVEVTADGRPARVRFTFDRPLEDAGHAWRRWQAGEFAPFELPVPGQTVVLPSPRVFP
jgi:hypothetical protein